MAPYTMDNMDLTGVDDDTVCTNLNDSFIIYDDLLSEPLIEDCDDDFVFNNEMLESAPLIVDCDDDHRHQGSMFLTSLQHEPMENVCDSLSLVNMNDHSERSDTRSYSSLDNAACSKGSNESSSRGRRRTKSLGHTSARSHHKKSTTRKHDATASLPKRGDLRMNRAVMARLYNPNLTLLEALLIGGFNYPMQCVYNEAKLVDHENIKLGQRKNQLIRRLRSLREEKRRRQANARATPDNRY